MSGGFWFGEARCVVFYEDLRLWGGLGGGTLSNGHVRWSGSAKEDPHACGGRGRGWGGVGSPDVRVSRVPEAL